MSDATGWIRCVDRMPDLIEGKGYSEFVLVFQPKYDDVFIAYLGGNPGPRWLVMGEEDDYQKGITHWMLLPTPPAEANP